METTYHSAHRIPAVSGGNILLGHTMQFQKDSLNFITKVAREYGPVATYRLGNLTLHAINHPDGVQRILHDNNRNYIKGEYYKIVRAVAGDGLIASEGEHWLRQRRLMQPSFHRQRISNFSEIMTRRTRAMLDRWEKEGRTNQVINFAEEMTDLTMGIITESMFSTQFVDQNHQVGRALAYLLEDVNYRYTMPFYPGYHVPTPRNLRARKALRIIDDAIYGIINNRRRSGGGGDDLLGMLMNAKDEDTGEGMTDRQLRDEVVTVFAAGHETTALALSWLFYLLSKNPEVANRLYAEVDALGNKNPDMPDLPRLSYTRQVIDETLRVYPPAWIFNRYTIADDEICGFPIKAGSIVMISPYVNHRLPEYWPEPDKFDPDRFSPDKVASRPRFAYLPFGGGPHQCIGNNFALVEATLVTAVIAQHFRLELAPGTSVVTQPTVTLRPKDGLPMIPRLR